MFGAMKGLDLMYIKASDFIDCLSKDDIAFLWALVLDKYKNREHYLFDCFFGSDDSGADVIPDDYVNELNDILYEHSQSSIDLSSSGHALDIIDKLNFLIDKYCILEGEAAEHEKEMKDLPAVKHDCVPKNSYIITVFYSDGRSYSRQLLGCSNGLVLNLQPNKLDLDSPERGSRFFFNLFNLFEPEKIVAFDISFQPVDDLPF